MMFDLWEGEEIIESVAVETTRVSDTPVEVQPLGTDMVLLSVKSLDEHPDLMNFMNLSIIPRSDGLFEYRMEVRPVNAFVMFFFLKSLKAPVHVVPELAKTLKDKASTVPTPRAWLTDDRKHIEMVLPAAPIYRDIAQTLNAYPRQNGNYRLLTTRILDFETLVNDWNSALPKIQLGDDVLNFSRDEIEGFDGTVPSLRKIPVEVLNVVNTDNQTYRAKKKSDKTLAEKLGNFGIPTLYDLLTFQPRRYIDKSNPQDISDLVIDEPATIIGTVDAIDNLGDARNLAFTIRTDSQRTVRATFWQQPWLKSKFPIGSEVLVTGKFYYWNRTASLNGTSIEHAKEAALLPIVPIYKQSESRGITTAVLLAAEREMFSRMDKLELPEWLQRPGRMDYYEAFKELHLPSSMERHREVMDMLGYYELVMTQILIQHEASMESHHESIVIPETCNKFQKIVEEYLPFELTTDQKNAVAEFARKADSTTSEKMLLNADVGAGKTLVAQLLCLRTVEAGYQTAFLAPTEVLAEQLYRTFVPLVEAVNETGENVKIGYLSGAMKVREKKEVLKLLESGDLDIVVGTHAVLADGVKFQNLGFVAIDEQQKFGAEQRTKLMSAREDGKLPHLLMQTATPIPRTVAQAMYGDIDMFHMKNKPKNRKEIKTELVVDDPNTIISQLMHPMWSDIVSEAEKGHQSFIITPLVLESDKIDSASVERTFKELSQGALSGLRVAYCHGKMKHAEQEAVMKAFRDKEYDVLVASTVVEVGVDIPDATRVVVLSADRLGTSTLHQIRGRVGRNSLQCKCYLVSLVKTSNAETRLNALVEFSNGFDVAEVDLATRGTGTLFGTSQSGVSDMMFGSIFKHVDWIDKAKEEAREILASPLASTAISECEEHFNSSERFV